MSKLIKYTNSKFTKKDISLLNNFCECPIPKDLEKLLSTIAQGDIQLTNDICLGFGDTSAKNLIDNYNTMTKKYLSFPAIVFAVDGNGNSITYAKKYKNFQIFILADSDFEETNIRFISNSIAELSSETAITKMRKY